MDNKDFSFREIIKEKNNTDAAVVIPEIRQDGLRKILFEVRATGIKDQPGDVCFPGGAIETGEAPIEAAVRECCEELLIGEDQIRIVRSLPLLSRLGLTVYPFLGEISDYDLTYCKSEVSEVFAVPFEFFLNARPDIHRTKWTVDAGEDFPYDLVYGGRDYKWRDHFEDHVFYIYGSHVIWGYTAKILYSYIESIKAAG